MGDLLQGHALNALHPHCRDEHHCLTAVPEHLSLLRKALAYDAGRHQPSSLPGPAAYRHGSRHRPRRPSAARRAPATSLTLSQWVSRLACVR